YLGSARADRLVPGRLHSGTHRYPTYGAALPPDHWTLAGRWTIGSEAASARGGSTLRLAFDARRVFLVLGSRGRTPARLRVSLDGHRVTERLTGRDVHRGDVIVRRQRLYRLVDLPRVERHELELRFDPGISAYAFTFG